jgi:hypothetical protein
MSGSWLFNQRQLSLEGFQPVTHVEFKVLCMINYWKIQAGTLCEESISSLPGDRLCCEQEKRCFNTAQFLKAFPFTNIPAGTEIHSVFPWDLRWSSLVSCWGRRCVRLHLQWPGLPSQCAHWPLSNFFLRLYVTSRWFKVCGRRLGKLHANTCHFIEGKLAPTDMDTTGGFWKQLPVIPRDECTCLLLQAEL